MSTVPEEFDPTYVAKKSAADQHMYRTELAAKDPMQSVLDANPEIHFVPPKRSSEWGQWDFEPGAYYDTTIGSEHPYWKDKDLPIATKDIERLRADMLNWGYCKIEGALSAEHVAVLHQRIIEQAEGERLAGIAQKTPSGQNINCCVNKGQCFEALLEQHPAMVQGGALVEQIVTEALGGKLDQQLPDRFYFSEGRRATGIASGSGHCPRLQKPAYRQCHDDHH